MIALVQTMSFRHVCLYLFLFLLFQVIISYTFRTIVVMPCASYVLIYRITGVYTPRLETLGVRIIHVLNIYKRSLNLNTYCCYFVLNYVIFSQTTYFKYVR